MRLIITVLAALSIFASAQASAQNAGSAPAAPPSSAAPKAGSGTAPVGHRQPTPAEVGKADGNLNPSAADKELDRKIKSICKGC